MDQIAEFLGDTDKYLAERGRVGRPITEKTLSQYLFKNSRRIGQLRDGVDINYRKLRTAQRALSAYRAEISDEVSQLP